MPLGGDGFAAPFAAYAVSSHAVTGDVSGGSATLRMNMDPRFCSLVSWSTIGITQGTPADAELRGIIGANGTAVARLADQNDQTAVAATVSAQSILRTWCPTPTILPGGDVVPFCSWAMTNVDGDVYHMDAYVFLFNIRVRELTPMGPLLWARGST